MPVSPQHLCIDLATREDASGIAELMQEPMPGAIRLRQITVAHAPGLRRNAVVVRAATGRILGHGAREVRLLHLCGERRLVGYLHGLRRATELVGDGLRLARALTRLHATRGADEANHDITAILSQNHRARRVLEGGLPGAPAYHHLADYCTTVISGAVAARWGVADIRVRQLPGEALAAGQAMIDDGAVEYAPVTQVVDDPESWWSAWCGDRLVGVVRRVDRAHELRWNVAGYQPALGLARSIVNLGLRLAARPTLPAPGADLSLIHAAHLTVPDGDPVVVRALLGALARVDPDRRVVWGLGVGHGLRPAFDRLPAWRLDSRIYAVGPRPETVTGVVSPEAAWL